MLSGDSVILFSSSFSFSKTTGESALGRGSIPVTYLMNVAIARKQYLPGVVNANRIGSVCAQSNMIRTQ